MSLDFEWSIQNSLKENKNMARNPDKVNLEKAAFLLKEAVAFINQVPNGKYAAFPYKDSYELASEIDKYLKQLKE